MVDWRDGQNEINGGYGRVQIKRYATAIAMAIGCSGNAEV